ncbi:hypothetical protein [Streptomyces californicus]|uniref:hypothetical protein n=1 Tax=Streptomyces californicus TaxID=67351 RepID=UPI00378A5092
MAWDEWNQIKSDTNNHMQLNQLTPGSGGSVLAPDLASSPARKNAAAKAIEEHLEPETKKAGAKAEESTGSAVKEFSAKDGEGWDTSAALKKAQKAWEGQVKALMERLSSEKTALRNTSVLLKNDDIGIALQVRPSSSLDRL